MLAIDNATYGDLQEGLNNFEKTRSTWQRIMNFFWGEPKPIQYVRDLINANDGDLEEKITIFQLQKLTLYAVHDREFRHCFYNEVFYKYGSDDVGLFSFANPLAKVDLLSVENLKFCLQDIHRLVPYPRFRSTAFMTYLWAMEKNENGILTAENVSKLIKYYEILDFATDKPLIYMQSTQTNMDHIFFICESKKDDITAARQELNSYAKEESVVPLSMSYHLFHNKLGLQPIVVAEAPPPPQPEVQEVLAEPLKLEEAPVISPDSPSLVR